MYCGKKLCVWDTRLIQNLHMGHKNYVPKPTYEKHDSEHSLGIGVPSALVMIPVSSTKYILLVGVFYSYQTWHLDNHSHIIHFRS